MDELFLLDGESYYLEVLSLTREFEIRQQNEPCHTLDGACHRQLLGTYCHYTMTVRSRGDQAELERFWNAVSRPVSYIECTFPYGQDTLTQKMYVESGSQGLLDATAGNLWDTITIRFRGLQPQVAA